MHVVEVRDPEHRGQEDPDETALLVRMDRIVSLRQDPSNRGQRERRIEWNLGQGWTDADAPEKGRTEAPKESQPRQGDVRPERIRDQVDGVPEIDECPDPVVLAERGAPGLEEGLRRDHEDFHGR